MVEVTDPDSPYPYLRDRGSEADKDPVPRTDDGYSESYVLYLRYYVGQEAGAETGADRDRE